MPNFYDNFMDEMNRREFALLGYGLRWQDQTLKSLKALQKQIENELLFNPKIAEWKRDELKEFYTKIDGFINTTFNAAILLSKEKTRELLKEEGAWLAHAMNKAMDDNLIKLGLTREFVDKAFSNVMIQGSPAKDWWKKESRGLQEKFKQQIRYGVVNGEDINTISSRVLGGAIDGVKYPGIFSGTRANANALVRTSVQTISANARREIFNKNSDVIRGIQQVSTLDKVTTDICKIYDLASWLIPDMKPIDGNDLPYNGGVPRHWQCRSGEVPLTYQQRLKPAFRPSKRPGTKGEPVSPNTNYEKWLVGLSRKEQDAIFKQGRISAEKAADWRAGKIDFRQLLSWSR
jgi:hypothetical protein